MTNKSLKQADGQALTKSSPKENVLTLEMVFEQQIGKADELYSPILEFQGYWHFVVLDSHVNDEIFNTFMATWLNYCYDEKPIDSHFLNNINNNETVLTGGLRLTKGDKVISPSCCAEFSDFKEWASITQGDRPNIWLGHDPTPYIMYHRNRISVMNDDGTNPDCSNDVFELSFTYQEFNQAFDKIIHDINTIKAFSQTWAVNYLPKYLQSSFIQTFDRYMSLT